MECETGSTICCGLAVFVKTTSTGDNDVQIISRILGEDELPWEGKGRGKELLKRAGRYKHAVLGLLRRDPQQRTRVQTFVQQYASIISTTTTTQQTGLFAPPHQSKQHANLLWPKLSSVLPSAHTL